MNINGIELNRKDFFIKDKFFRRKEITADSWCLTNGRSFFGFTSDGHIKKTAKYRLAFYTNNLLELKILLSIIESNNIKSKGYYAERFCTVYEKSIRYQPVKKIIVKRVQFSKKTKEKLLKKSGGKCAICGRDLQYKDYRADDYATVDHIIPLSKGGKNELSNLQITCLCCNKIKSNILPDVFTHSYKTVILESIVNDKNNQKIIVKMIVRAMIRQSLLTIKSMLL